MVIQHNLKSLNAWRNTNSNNSKVSKNLEKLSSGLNINRAADDAAGLAISEKMRGQIRGLAQGSKNIKDGISLINTADGYLNEMTAITQRIRELAVQASNGTYDDDDRLQIQKEIDHLVTEVDEMTSSAEFNGIKLFRGEVGEILYAPSEFETITPMDPAYIYANEEFGALGDVRIMNGTQAEQTVSAGNTQLAALNAGPDFPKEGVFIIRVGIPGPPAATRDAVLDFGELNGPGSVLNGDFNLDNFREFFMGVDTGTTDPVTGNTVYAGGAFSDWINAGEMSFEVTDAGAISVKTTGLGGSQANVTIGATSSVPTGKILANSAIFGATAYNTTYTSGYNLTGVSSALLTVPLTATTHPITEAQLWSLIPDSTVFTFQVQEYTWYDPTPTYPNGRWGSPSSVVATQSYTKAEIGGTTLAQANSNLSSLAAAHPDFNSFSIGASSFVDRDGQVRIYLSNSSSRNTALYPEESGKPTGKYTQGANWLYSTGYAYEAMSSATAAAVNTDFPVVTSNYPIKVSDEIGTLEIKISNIQNNSATKNATIVINFSDNTIRSGTADGAVLETFTAANENDVADMVAKLNLALNRSEFQPVPARVFPEAGAANSIPYPVGQASIVTVNGESRLRITGAERMFRIDIAEKQSDRPMFFNTRTVTNGTNQPHILQIDGTPSVNITIAPGDYGTDINEFVARNKSAFQPHYILRADDSGKSLVIESVGKGNTIDVRNIQFISPSPTNPSNLLGLLGFDSPIYDSSNWFVDGVSHPSYQAELPRTVIGVEMAAEPLWIQGGANRGEGLYILLPYLSASRLQFTAYEIPEAAEDAGLTYDTSGKIQGGLSVVSVEEANSVINTVDNALKIITTERVNFGATSNALEYMMSYVDNTRENLTAAESSIRDLDMAKEMMEFTKNNILTQAAQSMLAQANQLPQGVLSLLR